MKFKNNIFLVFFVCILLFCGVLSATDNSSTNFLNASESFVENNGQVDSNVSYYSNTFYGTSYVTDDGITHRIQGKNNTLVIKEQFLDKNGNIIKYTAKGENKSNTKISYLYGKDSSNWYTGLSTYNLVSLGELYPGITVKLRAIGSNIEKLFFLNPGANPDDIKIQVLGADNLTIDKNESLEIKTNGFEKIYMSKPIAYQGKTQIPVNYKTNQDTYKFQLGAYDHTKDLTIDPFLEYSTYIGGTNRDEGYKIVTDIIGNIYITGYAASKDFPITVGANQSSNNGSYDVFVTKLNPNGTEILYSTYLGGVGYDHGYSIDVDKEGNIYIVGETGSYNFPVTSDAFQTANKGSNDAFVVKLSPTGTLVYSTYLGGSANDVGYGLVVDNKSNVYITGLTQSNNFPVTSDAYQTTNKGRADVFLAKFDSIGSLLYSTYLGGSLNDNGYAIDLDSNGNVYLTGLTYSSNFPVTPDAFQNTNKSGGDVFIVKFNPTGTELLYSSYFGGSGYDVGEGIAIDKNGNVYLVGQASASDFPVTADAFQNASKRGTDAFIAKFNSTGIPIYSSYFGGSGYDAGKGIVVDNFGNAYIVGYTDSSDFPVTADVYQNTLKNLYDLFVAKFNSTGIPIYSTYLGGTENDVGRDITLGSNGYAFITGRTLSTDFPVTADVYQNINKGLFNVFVSKLNLISIANVTMNVISNDSLDVGDIGSFSVELLNVGPSVANGVKVVLSNIPVGWTVVPSVGSWDEDSLTWSVGSLVKDSSAFLIVSGLVTTDMAGTNITSVVNEFQDEFNQEVNSSLVSINVNSLADLYIKSWSDKSNVTVDEAYTITFKVGNRGPNTARDVVFTLPLPNGVEFIGLTTDEGDANYDPSTRTIKWILGDVLVKNHYLWLKVKSNQIGSFLFTPQLTTSTYDPNIKDNLDTVVVTVKEKNTSKNDSTVNNDSEKNIVLSKTISMKKTGRHLIGLLLFMLLILTGTTLYRRN